MRIYTGDELAEQGPGYNVCRIEQSDYVLRAVDVTAIYPNDSPDTDILADLYNPVTAKALAEDLRSGFISWHLVRPVLVVGQWELGDGHHRYAAHQLAGESQIMAWVPTSLLETA